MKDDDTAVAVEVAELLEFWSLSVPDCVELTGAEAGDVELDVVVVVVVVVRVVFTKQELVPI